MPPALGLSIASRSGLSAPEISALAAEVEARGLDSFHVAEVAADGLALAQCALQATDRLTIGTAIASVRLRHSLSVAAATATITDLFGPRFRLGLGMSAPAFTEQRLGLDAVRPLPYMRDYVASVRTLLSGGALPGGVSLDRVPTTAAPVDLAALLPGMLGLAGEIADGAIMSVTIRAQLDEAVEIIRAAALRSGRDPASVELTVIVPCCFDADNTGSVSAAAAAMTLTRLDNAAAARRAAAAGHADVVAEIAAALARGDRQGAQGAVTAELAREFVLISPTAVREMLDAPVHRVALFPVAGSSAAADWRQAMVAALDLLAPVPPGASADAPTPVGIRED